MIDIKLVCNACCVKVKSKLESKFYIRYKLERIHQDFHKFVFAIMSQLKDHHCGISSFIINLGGLSRELLLQMLLYFRFAAGLKSVSFPHAHVTDNLIEQVEPFVSLVA